MFIWVLRPFQEYFTYIEQIAHQRWAKTGEPGENHLTTRKQNLVFPRDLSEAGTTGEKPNGLRVNSPIHQATGACSKKGLINWYMVFIQ